MEGEGVLEDENAVFAGEGLQGVVDALEVEFAVGGLVEGVEVVVGCELTVAEGEEGVHGFEIEACPSVEELARDLPGGFEIGGVGGGGRVGGQGRGGLVGAGLAGAERKECDEGEEEEWAHGDLLS